MFLQTDMVYTEQNFSLIYKEPSVRSTKHDLQYASSFFFPKGLLTYSKDNKSYKNCGPNFIVTTVVGK